MVDYQYLKQKNDIVDLESFEPNLSAYCRLAVLVVVAQSIEGLHATLLGEQHVFVCLLYLYFQVACKPMMIQLLSVENYYSIQQAITIVSTFSGFKHIGVIKMRKRFARMPNAFSTTLRARLSL